MRLLYHIVAGFLFIGIIITFAGLIMFFIMKIVVAFDSFKGSATSMEVGNAVREAFIDVMPSCEVIVVPIADGGEGTVAAISNIVKDDVKWIECPTFDPLMRPIDANYCIIGENEIAAIELASASGLPLVEPNLRNPLKTTTYGTGILIRNALDHGCTNFVIGLGGSATNDGGIGMLTALGYKFLDGDKRIVEPIGASLSKIVEIDDSNVDSRLEKCLFTVACDVTNPMVGKNGAAYIFAPQKGADAGMVEILNSGLELYATVLNCHSGKNIAMQAGAGAAGGVGGGMLALLNAELKSGSEIILEMAHFSKTIYDANYVITGEGCIDEQSGMGKAVGAVLNHAFSVGVPVIGIAGTVITKMIDERFSAVFSIQQAPVSMSDAMDNITTVNNVYFTAKQVAKLIKTTIEKC